MGKARRRRWRPGVAHGADITLLKAGLERIRAEFADLGFTFAPAFGGPAAPAPPV